MFYLFVLWLAGNVAAWLSVAMTLHPADTKKSKRAYWIGCLATSLLTLGIVYAQYCDDAVEKVWSEEARLNREAAENRWKRDVAGLQKQILVKSDEIKGLMGDEEAMKRSIANKTELVNQLLTRGIDPAIEEHYKTLQLQLRVRSESLDMDKKILARYEKRMEAIYRLFLHGYDRWIQKAKHEGQLSGEVVSGDFSPIEIGHSPDFKQPRRANLSNNCSIWIQARPATVTNGKLSQSLQLILYHQQPSGGVYLIRVVVSEGAYAVVKGGHGDLTFEDYHKESANPADDDKEYLELIIVAVNQAMGYVTREVEAAKSPMPAQK